MKFNTIVKLFTALAAAVGAIYIVATYGDKIVEWAKGIMGGCCCSKSTATVSAPQAAAEDFAPAEESAKEEAPAEVQEPAEEAAEEAAAPEAPAAEAVLSDEAIPVADEEDFEG